jgi:CDP-glucose 4,6-dehydratase
MEGMVIVSHLQFFGGKRILVTGDTGFKGSWLCLWLAELGAEVIGLALPAETHNVLFPDVAKAGLVKHVDCDIRDCDAVRRAVAQAKPEIVFHLAAQALVRRSYAEPQVTFATNLLGSVNLLEAVRGCDSVHALVYITSDKCYVNKEWLWGYRENDELGGRDPYSASKACAELAIHAYQHSYFAQRERFGAASTRAGNVIGGGDRSPDRIVPDAISALLSGESIVLRNPKATRPWQHVLDPLHGYLMLALALVREPKRFAGSYNFGPHETSIRTVDELANLAAKVWGRGDVVHRADPDAPHESTLLHLSSEKAHGLLGWYPTWAFDRAVTEAVTWYREVRDGRAPLDVTRQQIRTFMEELPRK